MTTISLQVSENLTLKNAILFSQEELRKTNQHTNKQNNPTTTKVKKLKMLEFFLK